MAMKRNDGDLPVPLEGLADWPVSRARALKLLGATATAGAFAAFTGGTAEALTRAQRRRRRRRRRRLRARRRRQAAVTSPQQTVNLGDTTVGTPSPAVTIPVTNGGDTTVTIDPAVVGDGFTLGDLSGLDLTLQPGETVQIPVVLNALEEGVQTGELQVRDASDGLLLETVDLTGNVTAPVTP